MGAYELLEGGDPQGALEKGMIIMYLKGRIMKGAFSLVRMKGRGANNWLLMKKKDEHSRPGWTIKRALTNWKEKALREKVPPCEAV